MYLSIYILCIELLIHIISYPIFIGYSAMPPPYIPTPQLQPSTKKLLVNVSYTYCACKSTRNTTIMLTWVGSTVLGTCAAKRRLAARAEGARPCKPLSKPMASWGAAAEGSVVLRVEPTLRWEKALHAAQCCAMPCCTLPNSWDK